MGKKRKKQTQRGPVWPLLVELYRSGRGPHWDPEKDDQRPEVLLWRCYVAPGAGFMIGPPMDIKDFPYGCHWLVKDARGVLLGVMINEWAPWRVLREIEEAYENRQG